MHPILRSRTRLFGYLLMWVAFGALLGGVIAVTGAASLLRAQLFAEPLGVLLGLQCLPSWYLVRGLSPGATRLWRLLGTWLGTGMVLLSVWLALANGWLWVLGALDLTVVANPHTLMPLLVFAGCLGLLIAVLGLYTAAAIERSLEADRRGLQLRTLAREAEMSLLRRQLDPHFLFNSLNSVAALIGTDNTAARRMCGLLADFFRNSLRFSAQQQIPLREELLLIRTFLAIEEVRFGPRLRSCVEASPEALAATVPALLLQPLVENAIHHGIAHLVDGGEIRIAAGLRGTLLDIVVENTCDPDRPASRGTGLGLANVRGRVESSYGTRASMDVESGPGRFRVLLALPASPAEAPCVS